MDGIYNSTSSSGYSSVDDEEGTINAIHSDKIVRISDESGDYHVRANDDKAKPSDWAEKQISEFKINLLDRFDSGYYSIPEQLDISEKLGQGGFGTVWLVESNDKAQKYAFKVPFNANNLHEEQEKMETVGQHPNIIKLFRVADIDGMQGILMEYVPGEDLSGLLPEITAQHLQNVLSHSEFWGAVQYIVKEVLSGISHLEEQGYVHQDIKPQNIRFDKVKGIPVIIDLGNLGEFGRAGKIGTAFYSAPELFTSGGKAELSDKFDTYSTGQITYSLLSGVVNSGLATLFTAGAKYDDLTSSERLALLSRLRIAMTEYQKPNASGEYKTALNPISQVELDTCLRRTFDDSESLNSALEKAYSNIGSEDVTLDVMLERELPKRLVSESLVGRYRSGYQSSLVMFINSALHPNPRLRLNATEALKEAFVTDPLIDDQSAKRIIRKVLMMKNNGAL